MVKRKMNGKRIVALAALAALVTSGSAYAANPTQAVTIKWNTQQLATLVVTTNYTSTINTQAATAGSLLANANGGAGTCTATSPGNNPLTVDFGNVAPDTVKYTDCLFLNGADAAYATNDTNGYSLTVQETTAATHDANKLLCYLPNGSQTAAAPVVTARAAVPSIAAVTQTDATCSAAVAGAVAIKSASASTITSGAAATAGTLTAGGDIELVIQPNAPSGADQTIATWTLVLN